MKSDCRLELNGVFVLLSLRKVRYESVLLPSFQPLVFLFACFVMLAKRSPVKCHSFPLLVVLIVVLILIDSVSCALN